MNVPSTRTVLEAAQVSLPMDRGDRFSPMAGAPGLLERPLLYSKPAKKKSLSFMMGPPTWARASQLVRTSRLLKRDWMLGARLPVLSAVQDGRIVLYSTIPRKSLLPLRTTKFATVPVKSPYSALAPRLTTWISCSQLELTTAAFVPCRSGMVVGEPSRSSSLASRAPPNEEWATMPGLSWMSSAPPPP